MDNKKVQAKLAEIQARIPKEIKDRILRNESAYGALREVMEKSLSENITKEKRDEYETILKSGMLDKTVMTTDPDAEKEADEWLGREIQMAIKRGELPRPKPFKRKKK